MCDSGFAFIRLIFLFLASTTAAGQQVQDLILTTQDQNRPAKCPVPDITAIPNPNRQVHRNATVLIGADVLGKIAVVADYDNDELADEVMFFVTTTRLTEPAPVLLRNAKVVTTISSLVVEKPDRSVAIALSLSDPYEPPEIPRSWRKYSQVFVNEDGVQFSTYELSPVQQQPLTAYDHSSVQSWPPPFQKDRLYSGTVSCDSPGCVGCFCSDLAAGCTTGGCGAATSPCASPCSGGQNACGAGYFSCTWCRENPDGVYWCTSDCIECGTAGGS